MKHCTILVMLIMVVFASVAPLFANAPERQKIKIAAFNFYPTLFQDTDGSVKGFYVDFLNEIAKRENWDIEYVYGNWTDGLARIKTGEVDVLTNVAYTPERAQFMDYGKVPLLTVWAELYVPAGSNIENIRDVKGKKIALMKGDFNAANFKNLVEKFDLPCQYVEYGNFEDVFKAVSTGQADGGIANNTFGAAKESEYKLKSSGVIFNPFDIFFTVAKEENAAILETLDRYLNEWRKSETSPYHQARDRWSHGSASIIRVVNPWMKRTAWGLALLLIVAIVFVFVLRIQVRRKTSEIQAKNEELHLLTRQLEEELAERQIAQESLEENTLRLEEEIAAREVATITLAHSEERFRTAILNAPFPIMIHADDGQVVQISSTWTEITGYTLSDISTIDEWTSKAYGLQCSDIKEYIDHLYNLGSRIDEGEYNVTTRSGETRIWDFSSAPLGRLSDGRRLVISMAMDVTLRKQMEEAVSASDKFNQLIINSVHEGIIVYDQDLRYLVWNPFMEEMTGFKASEVIGKHPLDIFPFLNEIGLYEQLEKCLTGEPTDEVEFPFSVKGKSGWNIQSSMPLRNDDDQIIGVIGAVRDVTERHKAEEQLRQSQKMEAIGQLAGGVAHDFNNILTVISGYCSLLQDDRSLNEKQRNRIDEISSSAEKAAQLTRGLLAFSRKQPLIMKSENLADIVQHVHNFLVRIIGEDITLNISCSVPELPIIADRSQIEQVLINLATNARDSMPNGGAFSVASELAVLDSSFTDFHKYDVAPGRYALLTVSDTGNGISREHIEHIFEPFFTTKGLGKGTGLGLAIIYGIVKQHEGFINVYSEPGQGTTFRIYIPIRDSIENNFIVKAVVAAPVGGNETILVAEDEPSVRALVAEVLESYGYETILAEDGEDAIEKFKLHQDRIRLILMDMIMPKKNGKEANNEIQHIRPGTTVLFSSGYTADFIENRGVSENDIELIMKPVKPTELLKKIREMLDGNRNGNRC